MLLEISWSHSKRGGCFFSSLKANCFNKQSGRMSSLEGCYWCSSAIIYWLLSSYLNSGNEAHPSVISAITSPWCTKGASCETIAIVKRREIVLSNNERIAVHFRLEILKQTAVLCGVTWLSYWRRNLSENSPEGQCKDIRSDPSRSLQGAWTAFCPHLQNRQEDWPCCDSRVSLLHGASW